MTQARSFDDAAALYDATRPDYPPTALPWLVPDGAVRVLDLGAGTGKLTRQLVGLGLDVVAVEPSRQMLAELRAGLPAAEVHEASAEAIPLPDADVDAVVVAQAFHWFDAEPALREIARVLRPGGRLGMIWNRYDERVGWVARLSEITGYAGRLSLGTAPVPELPELFETAETREFEHVQPLTVAGLRELVQTHSRFLVAPEEEQAELLVEVDGLLADHPDLRGRDELDLPYSTLGWRATRR